MSLLVGLAKLVAIAFTVQAGFRVSGSTPPEGVGRTTIGIGLAPPVQISWTRNLKNMSLQQTHHPRAML